MNKRQRKREAHWIVARLLHRFLDLDVGSDHEIGDAFDYDEELRELAEEHERKGWKEPPPK